MVNINSFINRLKISLHAHQKPGSHRYGRRLGDPNPDLYGTADAAIILYTLGELPTTGPEHQQWVEALQSFQDKTSGLFHGPGHHPIHGTAFAISALELLNAKPLYPITALHPLLQYDMLVHFLDQLDWHSNPWSESQKGSGIYASLVLSNAANDQWEDWYFDWLWEQADPATGLWRKAAIVDDITGEQGAPLFHHLAGSFHYLFNLDYRHRKIRYPEKLVDTCLRLYSDEQLPFSTDDFSFNELDWLYSFVSVMKQTKHREKECRTMLQSISRQFLSFIERKAALHNDEVYDDLHTLCGSVCALAIVQSILPEEIECDRILHQVLDRRPFI